MSRLNDQWESLNWRNREISRLYRLTDLRSWPDATGSVAATEQAQWYARIADHAAEIAATLDPTTTYRLHVERKPT